MSAIAETQVLLYRALSQSADLPSVYTSGVSETATSPYIIVGETTKNDDSAKNRKGENFTVTLHVWHENSSYETKQIVADTEKVLEGGLSISGGFSLWLNLVEYSNVIEDPSGWFHGVLRVRLRIEE